MSSIAILSVPTAAPPPRQAGLLELQSALYHEARACGGRVAPLMTWLLDQRNLAAAWDRVAAADGADTPGSDGTTCEGLRGQLAGWLPRLADDLYHDRYRPGAVRWVEIPKPNRPGAVRRLGILNVRDRVVQTAARQVLEPVLDPTFSPASFGFRPGRGVAGALAEAVRLLHGTPGDPAPFGYAGHLDVADCFDTIDHTTLLAALAGRVADADFVRLVEAIVRAGGGRTGRLWWQRTCGLVQGGALSPMLCNLALHALDEALLGLARASGGGARALRYADDLLLLARDARLAERGLAVVSQALARLRQRLRESAAVGPVAAGVEWLGVRLQPRRRPWASRPTFGYVVPDARVADMIARLDEMTAPPSEKIDAAAFNLSRWVVSLNEQLRDWRQAYLYADNAPDVFAALDERARERVAQLLHSVAGTPWRDLYARYRARLPRGFWTWEVQGVRLTVLSSLAPHAPAFLTHRPAWMGGRRPRPAPAPRPVAAQPSRPPSPKVARPMAVAVPAAVPALPAPARPEGVA